MTSLAGCGRPAKLRRLVQSNVLLAYDLKFEMQHKKISEHCDLSKSPIWKILSELVTHPYLQLTQLVLENGDAEQCNAWSTFIKNQIQVQQTFLAGIEWTEACFSQNGM